MTTQQVCPRLHSYVSGYDDGVFEQVVSEHLMHRHLTLPVAESCIGSLVAKRLTEVPGSSWYILGAVVASPTSSQNAF